MSGILYLVPNTLGHSKDDAQPLALIIPENVQAITAKLGYFIAENAKTTRAFLKLVSTAHPLAKPLQEISIAELNVNTKPAEHRFETVRIAWVNTIKHLEAVYGKDLLQWTWGNSHTLTHVHPLGMQQPLDRIFNVGPFNVPGGRETPNNLNYALGTAPWGVKSGPSTRRVIDFAHPDQSVGINPVGQSGVLFDKHYSDQAPFFAEGIYMRQFLSAADVKAHTQSTLTLRP